MNIQFQCPNCHLHIEKESVEEKQNLQCPQCQKKFALHHFPNADAKELRQCPLCQAAHLYTQKKFPKKLGLAIVIAAAVITLLWDHRYYFTLIATAIIDFILYQRCPTITQCYLCHAEYSGATPQTDRTPFDLNLHERYRHKTWEG